LFQYIFSLQHPSKVIERCFDSVTVKRDYLQTSKVGEILGAFLSKKRDSCKSNAPLEQTYFVNDILPQSYIAIRRRIFPGRNNYCEGAGIQKVLQDFDGM
jgi:hypothetical protein